MFRMLRRLLSTARSTNAANQTTEGRVDLEKVFTQESVQDLLRSLTGCEPTKIFRRREIKKLENPKYMLMTEEDIEKMEEQVKFRCQQRLRMPPFKYPRSNDAITLCVDKEISGFDNTKFVFTDIDPEVESRDRTVVVRETDGTLRTGTADERDRMNRVYFPKTGQQVHTPDVFEEPYCTNALNSKKYEFMLDFACAQFEPDDAKFIEVCNKIFDHVNKEQDWEHLYSTRYYGNMVFRFVAEKSHEALLCKYITASDILSAANLIRLYYTCNLGYEIDSKSGGNELSLVTDYVKLHSLDKSSCARALDFYLYARKS
uniref:28S ribosomal protein S22, mitochondrial n=1 Tax=Romanomermis culicivorax TaxID=13658 RepID=A0A915J9Z3_ROMCU